MKWGLLALVALMFGSFWLAAWLDRQARRHVGDPHSLAVRPDRRGRYE